MQRIGERIQACRKKLGLKQETLAEKVEISPNYLSAIERGVKIPKLDTFIRIINALEVSADEILVDVINAGTRIKSTQLDEKLNKLPIGERRKILKILEVLVDESIK